MNGKKSKIGQKFEIKLCDSFIHSCDRTKSFHSFIVDPNEQSTSGLGLLNLQRKKEDVKEPKEKIKSVT